MNRTILASALAAATFFAPLVAHAQTTQTYTGNGATGFGGNVGNSSFKITNDGSGNITFALTPGSNGTLNGNDAVIYIDSVAGGFTDTSTFTDTGDGGRTAISGYQAGGNSSVNNGNASRTLATFAPGFAADYALSIEDGYFSLFSLMPVGNNSFNYITGAGQTGAPLTLTVTAAQLGLATSTSSFNFVGTLISTTAYRSNETIGSSTTTTSSGDNTNAAFTGSTTFTSFDTFGTPAAAPEPSGTLSLIVGALALGGLALARRRTVVA